MSAPLLFWRKFADPVELRAPGDAIFGNSGTYRYLLWRIWDVSKPIWRVVMLNPSKAGGDKLGLVAETREDLKPDHTITKLYGFGERADAGGFVVANLFSYVSTDSDHLVHQGRMGHDLVGPEGDDWLRDLITQPWPDSPLIMAWGAKMDLVKKPANRVMDAQKLIPKDTPVQCWGRTKKGQPLHPLMLAYATPLVPYPYTPALLEI